MGCSSCPNLDIPSSSNKRCGAGDGRNRSSSPGQSSHEAEKWRGRSHGSPGNSQKSGADPKDTGAFPKPPRLNLLLPHSPKSNSPLRKRPPFKVWLLLRDSPARCVIAHGKQKLCWEGWGGGFSPSLYLPTSWSAGRGCPPKFPSNSDRTSCPGQLTPSQWEMTGQRPTGFSSPPPPSPRSARLAIGEGLCSAPFRSLQSSFFFRVAPLSQQRGECTVALSKTANLKEGLTWTRIRGKSTASLGGGEVAPARFPFGTTASFSCMKTRNL